MSGLVFGLIVLLGAGIIWSFSRSLRRKTSEQETAYAKGLSRKLTRYLSSLPHYRRLPKPFKDELRRKIAVFLAQKKFFGCEGLKITDRMRVIIAAEACLLLLNKKSDYYPKLETIIVYPESYTVDTDAELGRVRVKTIGVPVSGESYTDGELLLSWQDALLDSQSENSPNNVVIHEFAHQLDQLDGVADGIPIFNNRQDYLQWRTVFSKAYEQLRENLAHGDETLLDEYGATNPAEFFAVATETFFGVPKHMKEHLSQLYEELSRFYSLNPAEWD